MPDDSTKEFPPTPGVPTAKGVGVPTRQKAKDASPPAGHPQTEAPEAFLEEYNFTKEQFEKSLLSWPLLCQISKHHTDRAEELKSTGNLVVQRLQSVPGVHSLKVRVKDPGHLVAKIIRMRLEQPELQITSESYEEHVKDLIGVRALHLFKDEWSEIHKFVAETWEPLEDPVAYVREGDEIEVEQFRAAGCRVELHPYGYRSIHFRFKSQPFKRALRVELQVRTIFEEAWSEIDHKLRYPRQSNDPTLTSFLVIFNRLAGFGDEMGMYAKHLSSTLRANSEQLAEAEHLQQVQEQELRKMLSQVQIGKKDKAELQKKLDALEKTSQTARQFRVSMGDLVTNINPSILGSLADLRMGPSINVTDSSSLFRTPNPFSVEVTDPSSIFLPVNPLSVDVKSPSSIFRSPNPLSVEVKSPSSLIGPGQSPPSIGTVPSSKSAASRAAFRRLRRRKQGEVPAAKKP